MRLPIAGESYQPSVDTLVRAVRRSETVLARLCATETVFDAVTAYTRADHPGVRSANFAAEIQQVGDVDPADVLAALLDHFNQQSAPCHTLAAAAAQWPDGFALPLEQRGFVARHRHVLCLDNHQPPQRINEDVQIVPARSVYGELRGLYSRMACCEHDTPADAFAASMIDRLDEPRLELYVGRLGGKPVAVAGVCCLGDIGVIRAAWTDPDHRGKGIARALMAYVLDLCKRAQFQQVIIDRGDGCPAIAFYQSLGFVYVGQYVKYYGDHT